LRENILHIIIIASCLWLASSTPALAYLDPGSGTLLVQGIIAALSTIAVSATLLRERLKNAVRRFGKGKPSDDTPDA